MKERHLEFIRTIDKMIEEEYPELTHVERLEFAEGMYGAIIQISKMINEVD